VNGGEHKDTLEEEGMKAPEGSPQHSTRIINRRGWKEINHLQS
jgi:hypothetical protein